MQLTLYTDYAIRTLLYLGSHPGQIVPVAEIGASYGISVNHLAKVAKMLVRDGLVEARRGREGGIRLARDPADICIGALVRATEEHRLLECFDSNTSSCPLTGKCRIERVMHEARQAFFGVLDRYTLADMLENPAKLVQLLTPAHRRARQGRS